MLHSLGKTGKTKILSAGNFVTCNTKQLFTHSDKIGRKVSKVESKISELNFINHNIR